MDAREKEIRQRLKDDYPHYAAKCLRISIIEQEVMLSITLHLSFTQAVTLAKRLQDRIF